MILVKVLSMEGTRIKLSRKAVLKEQRAKLGLPEPGAEGQSIAASAPVAGQVEVESADDLDDDDEEGFDDGEESADEPNFNRADGVPVTATQGQGQPGGARPEGQRRPGGRRRRGGRRPGGPGAGGAPQGGNRG